MVESGLDLQFSFLSASAIAVMAVIAGFFTLKDITRYSNDAQRYLIVSMIISGVILLFICIQFNAKLIELIIVQRNSKVMSSLDNDPSNILHHDHDHDHHGSILSDETLTHTNYNNNNNNNINTTVQSTHPNIYNNNNNNNNIITSFQANRKSTTHYNKYVYSPTYTITHDHMHGGAGGGINRISHYQKGSITVTNTRTNDDLPAILNDSDSELDDEDDEDEDMHMHDEINHENQKENINDNDNENENKNEILINRNANASVTADYYNVNENETNSLTVNSPNSKFDAIRNSANSLAGGGIGGVGGDITSSSARNSFLNKKNHTMTMTVMSSTVATRASFDRELQNVKIEFAQQQENLRQIIQKQALLVSVATLMLILHGIYTWIYVDIEIFDEFDKDKQVDDILSVLVGVFTLLALMIIPLLVWLSFVFADNQYHRMCHKCDKCFGRCCQKIALYVTRLQIKSTMSVGYHLMENNENNNVIDKDNENM